MKNSNDSLPRRRNPIPRWQMAAKLASDDELSPDRSVTPLPSPTLRRISLPRLSISPSHLSSPNIFSIPQNIPKNFKNPRPVARCHNPIPRAVRRRQMGAKLAEEEELSPENPRSVTPPPSPSRKTVDLAMFESPAVLPVPVGGSTIRQRCKGGRRLPRYCYRWLPCSFYPMKRSDSLSISKPSGDGVVAAGSSEAAPSADRSLEFGNLESLQKP